MATSPITLHQLTELEITAGFTAEDQKYLRLAGDILKDQTRQVVDHWRSQIIANIPHLARHSRSPQNKPLPDYLARSNKRFEQWILDTCFRDYNQDWLNYQTEIALRHTSQKKNKTDGVESTSHVPLHDIIAFTAVMNQTIKPYLAAQNHPPDVVDQMHTAWCKSLQLQIALWSIVYLDQSRSHSSL